MRTHLIYAALAAMALISCKEIGVSVDDEDLDAITDALGSDDDADDDIDADADDASQDSDVTETDEDSTETSDEGVVLGTPTSGTRSLLGTFKNYEWQTSCYDDYPVVMRLYYVSGKSKEYIDFESQRGELLWNATLFSDDTFDFTATFSGLDQWGKRDYWETPCTCVYYSDDWYGDEFSCACDDVFSVSGCQIYYKEM